MKSGLQSGGALALVASGVGSAFALAACCALPMLLVGAGLSPYWLGPVAEFGDRFGFALHILSIATLVGSVFIVLRSPAMCSPGALCANPWFRISILLLAILGVTLLVLARVYR